MEYIGERVIVIAMFGGKYRLRPLRFSWAKRVIHIKEITYSWIDMEGSDKVHHFSVTDGATLYELSFNTSSMMWNLEKVETEI